VAAAEAGQIGERDLGADRHIVLHGQPAGRPSAPAPPRAERDIEEEPVYLPPAALISPLRHLLAAADATPLLQLGQRLIDSAGHVVQSLIAPFEQRYYLLGVLAALISIMLLMAQ
jgi:hypothetical protein